MSKLLCNVLKISGGGQIPQMPPLLVARLLRIVVANGYFRVAHIQFTEPNHSLLQTIICINVQILVSHNGCVTTC